MQSATPIRVQIGAFELHLKAGDLRKGAERIHLQSQPLQILLMLVERAGDLVTREEIKKKLWPNDTVVEFDDSIHTALKKLRQALGDAADNPQYVETIARRGYRLIVPVVCLESTPADHPTSGENSRSVDGVAPRLKVVPGGLTGRTVSHYRVLDIIGGGGMGVVYKAEDLKLGRGVALKFLPEDLGSDPHALERFSREARAASSLDHPNICPIHEFGEHEGQPFMVMQLLEGQTLRDRLTETAGKGALPLEELLEIGIQVSDGLQAAHEKGIIHRDIKPANIFITTKGICKILDFGLVKLLEADQEEEVAEEQDKAPDAMWLGKSAAFTLTRTGMEMGTAGYMSPEQVRGEKLDARTDLFSLGLVLYEMATGQRAFTGETASVLKDAILHNLPAPVKDLNSTLPPRLEKIIGKAIEKQRELRYQSATDMRVDLENVNRETQLIASKPPWRRWQVLVPAAVFVVTLMMAGGYRLRSRESVKLTTSDTVVLADFTNLTSESIFDTALKPALEIELGQTPFLNLLSAEKVLGTLKLMGHPEDERLTPQLARDVCQHTNSKAVLAGSISDSGNQYQLEIKAIDCRTGVTVANAVAEAGVRNQIVAKLGEAGTSLREKLGERPGSLQRFNKSLDEAATSSIEALQAYAAGIASYGKPEAVSHFKRAAELDPSFALAYGWLADCHNNLMQDELELENATKAYQLRNRMSRRDELEIEADYYSLTGEWEKAISISKQAVQEFPRWGKPRHFLGYGLRLVGQYGPGAVAEQEALRLMPENMAPYIGLALNYFALDRLDDAKLVLDQAMARTPDPWNLHWGLYRLAFLQDDKNSMREQTEWATNKPDVEDLILREQSETEAYYGRLRKSHEISQRAGEMALRAGEPARAAQWKANEALRATVVGEPRALELAQRVLPLNPGHEAAYVAALAFANLGDVTRAQELSQQLNQQFPLNTLVQESELPTIQAVIDLRQGSPTRAIETLQRTAQYELRYADHFALQPVYVRGEAYLKAGQGQQAAAEFQKMLAHHGLVGNSITEALAHLQLARAQAMMGDKAAARKSYQDFLTLWKGADPDIPIYRQAKAEYANLR